jgi:hypothetical protein
LQSLKRDPAVNNRGEKCAENDEHQAPPCPKANSSHAITFLPRRR